MATRADQRPSRRARVRAATRAEILRTARKVLLSEGSGAISLRAIARDMGMTAPAIYRYFGSHEELIRYMVANLFTEVSDHVQRSANAAASEPLPADAPPWMTIAEQLLTACRAFRDWALANRAEFGLLFGSPLPALDLLTVPPDDEAIRCSMRFGHIFYDLFAQLYRERPFPIPADDQIDPSLREALSRFREVKMAADGANADQALPLGAVLTFLRAWVTLYGSVSLETLQQLRFALDDAAPLFELVLADLAAMIGVSMPIR